MQSDLLHLRRYHESGDAGAFQALVSYHANMVFATARRVTCDAALAEDVAQETFLELARKGRSITESVGAWLHRVAWRRACDAVRAEAARRRHESATATLEEGREYTWEELVPWVDEAIAELDPRERAVIVEHYLEGRNQTEIGTRMDLSQSAVSRLLERSLAHLRDRLKTKGLFCGAGLGAMMIAASSEAAPPSLMVSLSKIGLGGVGSAAAATTGGTLLLGLSLKAVLGGLILLTACGVAGYDLASQDSQLGRWLKHDRPLAARARPLVAPTDLTTASLAAVANQQRLLAEAKDIWARARKFSRAQYERACETMGLETDPEKRLDILRRAGFGLSHAAYDHVLTLHPYVKVAYNNRRTKGSRNGLLWALDDAWYRESPLEALAWRTLLLDKPSSATFPVCLAPWVRDHPDAWAAFVAAGPAPQLADYARLWVEDMEDPGSIWAKASAAGLDLDVIGHGIFEFLLADAPTDAVFRLIMRCPNAEVRSENIVGLAHRLSAEQLHQAANSGLFPEAGLVSLLHAMAGDPGTSFSAASAWLNHAAMGGGSEAQLARWAESSAAPFYEQWFKVDAPAALRHAVAAANAELLYQFMQTCAGSTALNEAAIVAAARDTEKRDRALAAYYETRAGDDPKAALQGILSSPAIADQVESVQAVLTEWTGQAAADAAAWAAALPAGDDRTKLIATVVFRWAQTEPEAAFAYAQKEGLSLSLDWWPALAWGARYLPEAKLAAILAPLRPDPKYNDMLTRLTLQRYVDQPLDAFALLSKYAAPGWQTLILDDVIYRLPSRGFVSSVEGYALQLPAMDLHQTDPLRVVKAAQLLAQRFADSNRLPQALDWTLKLPADLAPAARAEAFAKLVFKDGKQKTAAEQWIQRAAITMDERTALLERVRQGPPTRAATH